MTDEAQARPEIREHLEAVVWRHQVLPLLGAAGAGMDQRGVLDRRGEGQRRQVAPEPVGESLPGPERRLPGHRIEPAQAHEAQRRVLVVARHHRHGPLPHRLRARHGIGPVADHVAEAQHRARARAIRVGQHGGERLVVPVDIRHDGVADARPPTRWRAAPCGLGPARH